MERLTSPNINVDPGTDRFLHATIGGKEIDWKQCRDSTLNVLINGPTSNGFGKDIFRKMARDLYGRLKAIEDTGLSPQACAEAREIEETLSGWDYPISRMVDLMKADVEGRVVVLPCNVGDTVWVTRNPWTGKLLKKPLDAYVNGMKMYSHGLYVNLLFDTRKINGTRDYEINHIGKTVFLTHEEAEKALQEMEGKKNGKT